MIGVLIVTWNRKTDLLDCVRSVLRSDRSDLSIYVVDNASTDGTSEAVASEFPQVSLIRSEENLGFAGGNNLGLSRMLQDGVDAAFLLNDDAVIAEDMLSTLTDAGFDDPGVGVLAPKILFHSDPGMIWSAGGSVDTRTGIATQRFHLEPDDGRADDPVEIEYAVGCAMLVKTDAIRKAGLMDTDYFMYYEEADWCRRIRVAGFRILYVPRSRVRHKVGMNRDTSGHAVYYFARNRLLYLRRGGVSPSRIAWVAAAGILRSALGHAVHGRIGESRLMVRAVADYYSKSFGKLKRR
jgi:GT2 family glycosyltransferase